MSAQANKPLLSDAAYASIEREAAKFPREQRQSAVMAALAIAQDEKGWVSPEIMQDVADYMSRPLNIPVIDNTGLKGHYDLHFDVTPYLTGDNAAGGRGAKKLRGLTPDFGAVRRRTAPARRCFGRRLHGC